MDCCPCLVGAWIPKRRTRLRNAVSFSPFRFSLLPPPGPYALAYEVLDDDALKLTQWAWERCRAALKYGSGDGGGEGEAEITVGIVRG